MYFRQKSEYYFPQIETFFENAKTAELNERNPDVGPQNDPRMLAQIWILLHEYAVGNVFGQLGWSL